MQVHKKYIYLKPLMHIVKPLKRIELLIGLIELSKKLMKNQALYLL